MPDVLGLDIGPVAVRATLLRVSLRRTQLLRYQEVPLDSRDADALREAVRELVGALGKPPDAVVAELDGREGAALRRITLPLAALRRIQDVLPFELESQVPFDIEEAVVDYQEAGRTGTEVHVLATAAPKQAVAERLAALRAAGIEPKQLAVGAAALDGLTALLPDLAEGGPHVLLDVEEDASDLCILQDGRCVFARTLSSGLEALRAGRAAELERELRQSLAAFRMSGGGAPERILLAGTLATDPDALPWLQDVAGAPATFVDLPEAPEEEEPAHRARFARSAALAARLAVRDKRLDLRQGEFARRRALGALRRHGKLLAVSAAVVLAAFGVNVYGTWKLLDARAEALQARLRAESRALLGRPMSDPAEVMRAIEGQSGPRDPMPRFDAFDALGAVSSIVPEDVTHETRKLLLEVDDEAGRGRLEMQGLVASIAERDTIATALEEHRCFEELEKGRTSPGPGGQGLIYRLEAHIGCVYPEGSRPTKEKRRGRRRRRSKRGRR